MARMVGTVKWFNGKKGFGFITPNEKGDDLFVHQTAIRSEGYRTLAEGEIVEFEIEKGSDGKKKAVDVSGPKGVNVRGSERIAPKRDNFEGSNNGGDGYVRKGSDNRIGGGGGGRDGGDGYDRRSGGNRRGNGCYTCGEAGHIAKDCVNKGINGGGGRPRRTDGCFNCGGDGHIAKDCVNKKGSNGGNGDGRCYTCQRVGHMARDCEQNNGSSYSRGGAGQCYNCGEFGHFARDCEVVDNGGGSGGGSGGRRNNGRGCYSCGEDGHFARDCPNFNSEN